MFALHTEKCSLAVVIVSSLWLKWGLEASPQHQQLEIPQPREAADRSVKNPGHPCIFLTSSWNLRLENKWTFKATNPGILENPLVEFLGIPGPGALRRLVGSPDLTSDPQLAAPGQAPSCHWDSFSLSLKQGALGPSTALPSPLTILKLNSSLFPETSKAP